jgi:DNA invertase Pin-like site-specific DNA recombinase
VAISGAIDMRRARLEGRHIGRRPLDIGRRPLDIDRASVLRHREHGESLTEIAKTFGIGRATVSRIIKEAQEAARKGSCNPLRKPMKTGHRNRPEVAIKSGF